MGLNIAKYLSRLLLIALVITAGLAASKSDAAVNTTTGLSPKKCEDAKSIAGGQLVDPPMSVDQTRWVAASTIAPAHCQVLGYVAPQTAFDLRLPEDWNGKFMQIGCHTLCGFLSMPGDDCTEPLRRGYACVTTDMGHRGESGFWAFENPVAELDWAHRADHRVNVVGKLLATRYYGVRPSHAYFAGWSTGAREAMVAAQRYPTDFDGIIVGSGPTDWTGAMMNAVWISKVMHDTGGHPILRSTELGLLHRYMLSSCDLDDGVKDGIISNPLACRPSLEKISCRRGFGSNGCLTDQQVSVAAKLYSGPLNSKGSAIYPEGGLMPGSELSWETFQRLGFTLATDVYRYMAFPIDPGPTWTIDDFDFDIDSDRRREMEKLYSGTNPDLRAFYRRGGKMIVWHGWAEVPGPPLSAVQYYKAVEKTLGRSATQDFLRLFMIPGLSHELETGKSVSINVPSLDVLTALEKWVERGIPPEKLVGVRRDGKTADAWDTLKQAPLDARRILFSRPVYPYPYFARYTGVGDDRNAESFSPVLAE